MQAVRLCIAWRVSKYGVISGPHFALFSPNTRKYRPEITPYLDTFYAVLISVKLNSIKGKASFLILLKKENTHLQHTGNGHFQGGMNLLWKSTLKRDYFEKTQQNDSHFKNIKNLPKRDIKMTMISWLWKTHQKKHVEVASIFYPSKLHRKSTPKLRGLFCNQNYIQKACQNEWISTYQRVMCYIRWV